MTTASTAPVSALPLTAATSVLRSAFSRAGASVWAALAASGQARAQRELLDFATRCEGLQPELAKELRLSATQIR